MHPCIQAQWVCWLVLPGGHTGLAFQEGIVHIVCPQKAGVLRRRLGGPGL